MVTAERSKAARMDEREAGEIGMHGSRPAVITFGHVATVVLERLCQMIVAGELRPGQWLRQDDLARQLGVSSMPVREALRRLESEGLVAFYPRRGARVARLSAAEMEELWSIREELAVLAAHWTARDMRRIPLERLRRLYAALEQAHARGDLAQRMALSRQFFFAIFEAGEKEYLTRLLSTVWDRSFQYRLYFLRVAAEVGLYELEPYYLDLLRVCEAQDGAGLVASMRACWQYIQQSAIHRAFVSHLRELETRADEE